MSTTFQKRKEDFCCEHCGRAVKGTGYTNHCPHCLWSKHVDVFPGDRSSSCQGMMKPIWIDQKNSQFVINHQCIVCGSKKKNKTAPDDSLEALIAVMTGKKAA